MPSFHIIAILISLTAVGTPPLCLPFPGTRIDLMCKLLLMRKTPPTERIAFTA